MTPFLRRAAWLFTRARRRRDLDEELRFHLEAEADDRRDASGSDDEARRRARLDFGNPAVVREDTRSAWGWPIVEQCLQDLRHALRLTSRNPAFSSLAVLSLALGIGANVTIFSFTDAVLLRSLPVPDPASLVRMTWWTPESEVHGMSYHDSDYGDQQAGFVGGVFSYPALDLFRHSGVFSGVFAYQSTGPIATRIGVEAELSSGEYVSGSYFPALGVPAAAGRLLTDNDDQNGAPLVAVLDFGLAAKHFADPSQAPGQTVEINGHHFTVVGVAPRGFFGTDPGAAPAVYLPLHSNIVLDAGNPYSPPAERYSDSSEGWLEVMARVRPDVPLTRAQSLLAPVFKQFSEDVKRTGKRWEQVPQLRLVAGAGGIDGLRREYSRPLLLLLALAGLILALACANIANLLMARTGARTKELAVRLTLGAGRGRLVRQLLTESLLLSCLGGAIGLGLAMWGQRIVTTLLGSSDTGFTLRAELTREAILVALALSLLTGLVFGWIPALSATRMAATPAADDVRSRGAASTRRGPRRALLIAQVAMTLVMLVAAGLFARTLANLHSIDTGFDSSGLLTFTVDARQAGLEDGRALDFYRNLQTRLRAVPGVRLAAMSDYAVIGDGRSQTMVLPPRKKTAVASVILNVGGEFLSTMNIPVIRGREIQDADNRPGAPPVLVVSETFAREALGGIDPVGQQLRFPGDSKKLASVLFEIVGVTRDATVGDLQRGPAPTCYLPFQFELWGSASQMVYELRTGGDPMQYVQTIRRIVHETNPGVPVSRLVTQGDLIDQTISRQVLLARLCAAFAVLAFAIAIVGLYGTVLYDVTRRTAEIGIRIALGATRSAVVWMVLRDVVGIGAWGLLVGVPAAILTVRAVESLLVGVQGHDPVTLTAAAAILLGAATLAGFVPARKAAKLNPTMALRRE